LNKSIHPTAYPHAWNPPNDFLNRRLGEAE
jgi:hypothetical protein